MSAPRIPLLAAAVCALAVHDAVAIDPAGTGLMRRASLAVAGDGQADMEYPHGQHYGDLGYDMEHPHDQQYGDVGYVMAAPGDAAGEVLVADVVKAAGAYYHHKDLERVMGAGQYSTGPPVDHHDDEVYPAGAPSHEGGHHGTGQNPIAPPVVYHHDEEVFHNGAHKHEGGYHGWKNVDGTFDPPDEWKKNVDGTFDPPDEWKNSDGEVFHNGAHKHEGGYFGHKDFEDWAENSGMLGFEESPEWLKTSDDHDGSAYTHGETAAGLPAVDHHEGSTKAPSGSSTEHDGKVQQDASIKAPIESSMKHAASITKHPASILEHAASTRAAVPHLAPAR